MADKVTPEKKRDRDPEEPGAPRKMRKVDVPDDVAFGIMRKSLDAAMDRCTKVIDLSKSMTVDPDLQFHINLLVEKVEDANEAMNNVQGPLYTETERYVSCNHPGGKNEAEMCSACGGSGGRVTKVKTNVWKYVN